MMFFLRKIRILAILIIPALVWVGYNNAANWHLHRLEFGLITTHSHSYEKTSESDQPFKTHKHNNWELIILNQIFQILLVITALAVIAILVKQSFHRLVIQAPILIISNNSKDLIPVRGPPSV